MKETEDGKGIMVENADLPIIQWALLGDALTRMSVAHLNDEKATVFTFSNLSMKAVRLAISHEIIRLETEMLDDVPSLGTTDNGGVE